MAEVTYRDRVVIGTDGSQVAHQALRWGGRWAAERGLGVTVVRSHSLSMYTYMGAPAAQHAEFHEEELARQELWDAEAVLREAHPDLDVQIVLHAGSPAGELVAASADAALTVIGSRGRSPLAGTLLGGTTDTVITHGNGPIAVVPAEHANPEGPIVVGVDDEDSALHALRYAADVAAEAASPVPVLALGVWPRNPISGAATFEPDKDEAAMLHQSVLRIVAPVREEYPSVEFHVEGVVGDPAHELARKSELASVIVVGSRGRGGFRGLLLGSTSRKTVSLARCPTIVVYNR
ncbi:MAG: universal stress protein [Micrococcales bacterium]|nr:universal stress protein [Micrococcales bacterium]